MMTDNKNVPSLGLWRMKPLEQCSREELMECILYLSEQNSRYTTPASIDAMAMGSVEMIRRGSKNLNVPGYGS